MEQTFKRATWEQLAKGITGQFGESCEVVIHDLTQDMDHTIVYIENGHVTGRKVGDGSSKIVIETLNSPSEELKDRINYRTQTEDGKILKSTTLYIRNEEGVVVGVFSINLDITSFMKAERTLNELIGIEDATKEVDCIHNGVMSTLNDLIGQSVKLVNKPVGEMTRDDKIKAIKFLQDSGAFLIKKSGDKVSKFFGISKFTLYNYIDVKDTKTQ
ncbi:MAG: transcriptional regulator [Clostridia bacterium]|jgi:predicted transcriptional regulator YheO|nr:transcriptional regulator [Clostridia bacterium]MBT7121695.1 transcriptional regulator [Clostridia bacterium]